MPNTGDISYYWSLSLRLYIYLLSTNGVVYYLIYILLLGPVFLIFSNQTIYPQPTMKLFLKTMGLEVYKDMSKYPDKLFHLNFYEKIRPPTGLVQNHKTYH